MEMTGAQIIIESLKRENVEIVFGYPGGQIIPTFDALYDYDCFNFILPRHEQGGVHAADGYARVSGKPGVVIVTSGPGATNTITGIANAYMDSIPLICITGQVPTNLIGNDAFQESDITGLTRPITKHNFLVKDISELAYTIKKAFYIATTGRPGPVVIDVPSDIQKASYEFDYSKEVNIRSYKPNYEGNIKQIKKVAELINEAKTPIFYAGGGVIYSEASAILIKIAEKVDIPITTTLMALGAVPTKHPLNLGMLGMHGTYYANLSVQTSDLIIAVGARFDDRVTGKVSEFAPNAKIIHIDIDPTSIAKIVKVDVPIVGDCKIVLDKLLDFIEKKKNPDWLGKIKKWKQECPLTYKKDDSLRPQAVVEKIAEITKGDAIICTDVGQHQMWAAQYSNFTKPRTFVTSGGLGTMGFGLPTAIGAQLADMSKNVFVIAGDGGIQMNIQELATAVLNKIPIKVIILNNGYLGMVRQWQEILYNKRYSHTLLCGNPDFVKLAESYGAVGIRITKKDDIENAIKKAIDIDNVVVLDFMVEKEENVFPFVPGGKAIHEIMRGLA
ncbi:MAG: biosynthetic-type acetolactate synthase large subunit [Elusimicrobiota bacterium]|jgi:acetolactate synthase-1/2/3 large subunit|nr:biosynthetic-type acetolactate synthase large subunit [Elusimicrobiota bacterium]